MNRNFAAMTRNLTSALSMFVLGALLVAGCDSYEAPLTSGDVPDEIENGAERGASLGKIVENELGGVLLANGFRVKLLNVNVGQDGSRTPRTTFTWEVSKEGATSDMTQFAVEIPSVCTNPATVPAPANANPVGSPSNGFNFNNGVPGGLQGLVGEFHPNNSDKDSPRQFSLTFNTAYRVGYTRAAVQTTGNNGEIAWVLGPCANVFDGQVSVFEDLDGSGTKGAGETGIAGVTVSLLENGSNTPSVQKTTDANGAVEFVGLFTRDTYGVTASGPAVDNLVLTASPPVTISNGTGGVIGFDKFDVRGNIYVDPVDTGNANTEEEDPAGLGGLTVELWTRDGNGQPDVKVASTTSSTSSGSLGDYAFPDRDPGAYVVVIPDADGTLNAQIFDFYDPTTPSSLPVDVGNGLNGSSDPYYCDPADFNTAPAAGSACGIDFGWAPNNNRLKAAFTADGNQLTTGSYSYWKRTMATACRLWGRGQQPILNLSDGSSVNLNNVVTDIKNFAFASPFFSTITNPTVCDAKTELDRPTNTELLAFRAELITAELNAFTPTFGLSIPGVDLIEGLDDPQFIIELLRFAEADYIERAANGFPNQKVGTYSTTTTMNAYNGGGGGGGTDF